MPLLTDPAALAGYARHAAAAGAPDADERLADIVLSVAAVSAADVAAWTDPVPSLAELGAVHFVGIGGAGMSGIARILLARGVRVSGSDRRDTPTLLALRALGARVDVGHDPAHLADADTVVVSTAIRADNPELRPPASGGCASCRARWRSPRPWRAGARRRRRHARQDHDHVDAHRRRPDLRARPVVRDRRRSLRVGPQRALRRGRHLRRRGRRERPVLPPPGAVRRDVTNVEADHLDNYGDLAAM